MDCISFVLGKGKLRAFLYTVMSLQLIPVASRYKAWVYGRSLAGVSGSNPAANTDICLFSLLVWGM